MRTDNGHVAGRPGPDRIYARALGEVTALFFAQTLSARHRRHPARDDFPASADTTHRCVTGMGRVMGRSPRRSPPRRLRRWLIGAGLGLVVVTLVMAWIGWFLPATVRVRQLWLRGADIPAYFVPVDRLQNPAPADRRACIDSHENLSANGLTVLDASARAPTAEELTVLAYAGLAPERVVDLIYREPSTNTARRTRYPMVRIGATWYILDSWLRVR